MPEGPHRGGDCVPCLLWPIKRRDVEVTNVACKNLYALNPKVRATGTKLSGCIGRPARRGARPRVGNNRYGQMLVLGRCQQVARQHPGKRLQRLCVRIAALG
jgi:hypothetical protein